MKHLLLIILILTLSFQGFSQKKGKPKPKSKPKTTKITQAAVVEEILVKEEPVIIDTLRLQKGKKYILLVDIDKYSGQSNVAYANPDNSEEKELINNFKKDAFKIINIKKYTFVIFENKQTLDVSQNGESYQTFAYWSGKIKDNIQVKKGAKMATEFVSQNIGGKKESSYVINARKFKKEVAAFTSKNKITPNSKDLMNAVLADIILPFSGIREDDAVIFKRPNEKVKTIDSYITNKKGIKTPLKSIVLNENEQPVLVKNYNREGKEDGRKTFVYKDGLLTKIMNDDKVSSTINYDDNKMIFTENVGDANDTRIVWLENGNLLQKVYTIMIDDSFSYMNSFAEEKIENNCISYYINNVIWTKTCSSETKAFPFTHKYTSYQKGEVLQFRKSKIEKKGEKTFEKYYSDAALEQDKDNFKLFGTFQLNDHNLVNAYNFTKDKINQTIKIDYTYYQ